MLAGAVTDCRRLGYTPDPHLLILERQREGIAAAKKRGVYTGRKPSLDAEQADELRRKAAAGQSKAALAREYGISRETVYAYLRAGDGEPPAVGTSATPSPTIGPVLAPTGRVVDLSARL